MKWSFEAIRIQLLNSATEKETEKQLHKQERVKNSKEHEILHTWNRQTCTSRGKLLNVIGQMKVILVATAYIISEFLFSHNP